MCNEHCLDRWINGWVIELGRQDRAWQAGQGRARQGRRLRWSICFVLSVKTEVTVTYYRSIRLRVSG